jgi:thiamine biosynthesis lipoprotein ApbE
VTVIDSDVITAEAYAKAILIGGEAGLPNLLKTRRELTFIAVDLQGNLTGSPNYKEFLYELTSDSTVSAGNIR